MFTIEQIKAAHSKVKSGADFPAYLREIKDLGISSYITQVADGTTEYHGAEAYSLSSGPRYAGMDIAPISNPEQFKMDLKEHQQGKTGFPEFCAICASLGVERWEVSAVTMDCTYYDTAGNEIYREAIPAG